MTINIKAFGKGKPLVFFHGWGFDHTVWLNLVEKIHDQYTVYLVDLPGFGKTPMMDWPSFKDNLLVKLPGQFALLGWSLGGLLATRLAIEESSRVTHVINVATSPCFIKDTQWPGIQKTVLDSFFSNLRDNPKKAVKDFIALQLQTQISSSNGVISSSIEGLEAGLQILSEWDLRDKLSELTQPVCYLFGRLDAIVPRTILPFMQTRYSHFSYALFEKSAHMPFMTDVDRFIIILHAFLNGAIHCETLFYNRHRH